MQVDFAKRLERLVCIQRDYQKNTTVRQSEHLPSIRPFGGHELNEVIDSN